LVPLVIFIYDARSHIQQIKVHLNEAERVWSDVIWLRTSNNTDVDIFL